MLHKEKANDKIKLKEDHTIEAKNTGTGKIKNKQS